MLASERLRLLVFVAIVASVFLVAASTLIRLGYERWKGLAPPASRGIRWLRRLSLAFGALGFVCVAYGRWVEPYWPEVTHVRIPSEKLAAKAAALRIALISDLHSDPQVRLEERLPDLIAAEHPDVILFAGDAINSLGGLPNFRRCMKRIGAIAPTFAVRGNWDAWFWSDIDLYSTTGVRELDGSGVEVRVGSATLWIAGMAVEHEGRLGAILAAAPPGDVDVLVYHYPDEIEDVGRAGGIDLYCAGHTHGGQVALPFYGALLTFSRFGKRFESGLHRVGAVWLYVNRGIGMEGGNAPRVRFCARPEITILEIVPESPIT